MVSFAWLAVFARLFAGGASRAAGSAAANAGRAAATNAARSTARSTARSASGKFTSRAAQKGATSAQASTGATGSAGVGTINTSTVTGSHNVTSTLYSTVNTTNASHVQDAGGRTARTEAWRREAGGGGETDQSRAVLNSVMNIAQSIPLISEIVRFGKSALNRGSQLAAGPLRKYDPKIAYSAAMLDVGRIRRDIDMAQQTSDTSAALIDAVDRWEDTTSPFKRAGRDFLNRAQEKMLGHASFAVENLDDIAAMTNNPMIAAAINIIKAAYPSTRREGISGSVPGALFDAAHNKQFMDDTVKKWERNVGPGNLPSTMQ